MTASSVYASLNPGWNLGNTLDAIPDEGSWNNAPVVASTFAEVQARGFKSVRIPVTWAYHFIDGSPTWNINSTWMDRVETVVNEALSLGLYVIVNVHHDSWIWADVTAAGANYTMIEEKFFRLWSQIGTRFQCTSSNLIFEPVNEPPGTTQAHGDELNKLNGLFLEAINLAGGFNPQRVVSLSGPGMDSYKTEQFFVAPTNYTSQPWGLQFHYYSPYDFIFSAWGKTIWGSVADKLSLYTDFSFFYGNFSTIPTFIGEWSASTANTETAARWTYFDYFIRTARSFNFSTILWDNGGDHFNRVANVWYDNIEIDILLDAAAGENNTLPNSTTDTSATSQNSSAYIFHKVGDPVIDQTASYFLNGNTLLAITNSAGTTLTSSQFSINAGVVTLTAAYLGTLYTSTSAPGIQDTLTLTFSSGAPLTLQIVQYDTPVFSNTTFTLNTAVDLVIPVTYKGLPEVAAVAAHLADGTYLADSWTVYLGPLQQARWTYGNWGFDSSSFIVYASALTAIQAAAQNVTLTVEFFPRSIGSNSVNITILQ